MWHKILQILPPETAHRSTVHLLKTGLYKSRIAGAAFPTLQQKIWGLDFNHPVGLAAGFDKDAEVLSPLFKCGFSFVEAGTVTPKPQNGNPKPRIFRDKENQAVINAMGFPGQGIEKFKQRVNQFAPNKKPNQILGINIGKNKTSPDAVNDYKTGALELSPWADYIVINISSPNTPNLRDLQHGKDLHRLITTVSEAMWEGTTQSGAGQSGTGHKPPILVKIAPDLDRKQCADMADIFMESDVDGIIISNTTLDRPHYLSPTVSDKTGGLSGRPLFNRSGDVLKQMYRMTEGKIPLIGVGGVSSAEEAYAKIKSGASLVQLYTALIFQGPKLITEMVEGLDQCLKRDGVKHISDVIGVEV